MKLINYRGAYITPLKINEPDWALLPSVNVNALEYKDKELFWGQKQLQALKAIMIIISKLDSINMGILM